MGMKSVLSSQKTGKYSRQETAFYFKKSFNGKQKPDD